MLKWKPPVDLGVLWFSAKCGKKCTMAQLRRPRVRRTFHAQTLTIMSCWFPTLTMYLPLGEKATQETPYLCDWSSATCLRSATSHSLTAGRWPLWWEGQRDVEGEWAVDKGAYSDVSALYCVRFLSPVFKLPWKRQRGVVGCQSSRSSSLGDYPLWPLLTVYSYSSSHYSLSGIKRPAGYFCSLLF